MTKIMHRVPLQLVISIHMPHTWHDVELAARQVFRIISIHMPHTWHDVDVVAGGVHAGNFNPHATYVA